MKNRGAALLLARITGTLYLTYLTKQQWHCRHELNSIQVNSTAIYDTIINRIPSTITNLSYTTEHFSNDCRKTNTNVITPSNHNKSKQRDEPIRIPSNYL